LTFEFLNHLKTQKIQKLSVTENVMISQCPGLIFSLSRG